MGERRHLTKAPIREGLIDLQFRPRDDVRAIEALAEDLSRERPGSKISDMWEALFKLSVEQSQAERVGTFGKRIDDDARHQVIQLRKNGFTFSQLPPYDAWEAMCGAAMPVWRRFADALKIEAVERVAVRYINAVQIPLPLDDFATYLTAPPLVPPDLPQEIGQFLTRIAIPFGSDVAITTQTLEGEIEVDGRRVLQLIVDIDVFHVGTVELGGAGGGVQPILDRMREIKNRVFFSLLTDRALEMYS